MEKTPEVERWRILHDALNNIALAFFKYIALLNGGAAVALLAYAANVGQGAPSLTWSLKAFALGLIFGGIGLLLAYVTELNLLQEELKRAKPGRWNKHQTFLVPAFVFAILSLAAFTVGAWSAADSLALAGSSQAENDISSPPGQ